MAAIWRTRDRLGREIALTEAEWTHILDRHDELAGLEDEVRAVVETPDRVTRDAERPHRECHYRRSPAGRPWLKVVVHYRPVPPQGTWAGEVITAHPAQVVKRKEQPLWP